MIAVSRSLYELVALGARYVFVGLMLLVVLRAWRITIVDSQRANALRRLSPQTGLSGELLVLEGDGKARQGMRYPVIREGMIGASRRADIRIRHSSVRRKHAWFQLGPEGLTLRARPGAVLRDAAGRPARSLTLRDGETFALGRVRLLLVLTEAAAEAIAPRQEAPDPYDVPPRGPRGQARGWETPLPDPDDLFAAQPVLRRGRAQATEPPEDYDAPGR